MLRYGGKLSSLEYKITFFDKFKATEEGEKDIKVKKAHLSVDSRAITIIPEKVKYFNAVQGIFLNTFIFLFFEISHD